MAKKKRKTKKGDHFLKQWREYRDMTQEELAAAAGTNASVISLLETGERGLSNKWLERLAPILKTKKGFILDVDPHGAPAAILDIWGDIPTEDQPHAIKVLETFKKRA